MRKGGKLNQVPTQWHAVWKCCALTDACVSHLVLSDILPASLRTLLPSSKYRWEKWGLRTLHNIPNIQDFFSTKQEIKPRFCWPSLYSQGFWIHRVICYSAKGCDSRVRNYISMFITTRTRGQLASYNWSGNNLESQKHLWKNSFTSMLENTLKTLTPQWSS